MHCSEEIHHTGDLIQYIFFTIFTIKLPVSHCDVSAVAFVKLSLDCGTVVVMYTFCHWCGLPWPWGNGTNLQPGSCSYSDDGS